ncbi:MAG: biotin/lipoyl-containing protein [Syntrophobacteraceae bacterium]
MRRYKVEVKGKEYVIYVRELSADHFSVVLNDEVTEVRIVSEQDLAQSQITPGIVPLRPQDETAIERPEVTYSPPSADVLGPPHRSASPPPLPPKPSLPSDGVRADVTSPMPGVIQSVEVKAGDEIKRGQTLLILEAMKMKNLIKSPRDGKVESVKVQPGQCVSYGDVLVKFAGEERS